MMARTRFISDEFWSDPDLVDLTAENRLALLLFLTSKESNIIGIYRVIWRVLGAGIGWTHEQMLQAARALEAKDVIDLDEENNWVWVKCWWKHNSIRSAFCGNVAKPALRELNQVPDFWKENVVDWLRKNDEEGACKGLPSPSQENERGLQGSGVITTGSCTGSNTTTTTLDEELKFPSVLDPKEKAAIHHELLKGEFSQVQKQELLDELAGALLTGSIKKGPIPFFRSLLKKAVDGKFFPSLGIAVSSKRAAEEKNLRAMLESRQAPKIDAEFCKEGEKFFTEGFKPGARARGRVEMA